MLSNEAPPEGHKCASCHVREIAWRCLDCSGNNSECTQCFRDRHRFLPFHRLEHWGGTYFEPAWTCQVGVEIHLGHRGNPCPSRNWSRNANPTGPAAPSAAAADFNVAAADNFNNAAADNFEDHVDRDHSDDGADDDVDWVDENDDDDSSDYGLPKLKGEDVCVVVDKSGVHRLRVRPCICPGHSPLDLQYLDMGLFPASLRRIRTAFTFALLDDFRMDNLECKTAGLNYYNKLRRITSNDFPRSVPVYFLCADKPPVRTHRVFAG
jgi:hypothetical protein